MNETADRVRIVDVKVLSDDWYVLKKVTFDYQRADGSWQRLSREAYDRGNGATLLLYEPVRRTVVLTRQFRLPAFVNGHDGMLIEVPGGLLEAASPEERIRAEVEEETGYRVHAVRKVFEAFMSPGSVTEKLFFWVYPDLPKEIWGRSGRVQGALLCRRKTGSRLAEGHPKGMALTRAYVAPTLAEGLSARLLGRQA